MDVWATLAGSSKALFCQNVKIKTHSKSSQWGFDYVVCRNVRVFLLPLSNKMNTSVKRIQALNMWGSARLSALLNTCKDQFDLPLPFSCAIKKIPEKDKNGMFTILAFPSDSVFVFLASTKMRFAFSEELFHTPLIDSLVPLWNILDEKATKNDSFTQYDYWMTTDGPYVMMMLKQTSYSIHIVYKPCQSAWLHMLNLSGFWHD